MVRFNVSCCRAAVCVCVCVCGFLCPHQMCTVLDNWLIFYNECTFPAYACILLVCASLHMIEIIKQQCESVGTSLLCILGRYLVHHFFPSLVQTKRYTLFLSPFPVKGKLKVDKIYTTITVCMYLCVFMCVGFKFHCKET